VASAITLDAGLRDAFDHPERAGVVWDGTIVPGREDAFTEEGFVPSFTDGVQAVPAVTDSVQVDRTVLPVDQASGVPAYSLREPHGDDPIALATLEGRGPRVPGEVALGPDTAKALGVGIGDVVHVGEGDLPATVVGIAFFPAEVHAAFDQGVWLDPADYDAANGEGTEGPERLIAVRFADGMDDAGLADLNAVAAPVEGYAGPAEVPPELANLRDVRTLPRLLAAFLAVLAVAALLHVLMTTARARAHEFAVLRAIGITRRGTRAIVNVQGIALFLVGLVLGLPLGVAAGRTGWSFIADRVPLEDVSPFAVLATILLVPIALLVARAVAIAPGWRVSRLRAAEVLRTE
jgi:hypothetical protein